MFIYKVLENNSWEAKTIQAIATAVRTPRQLNEDLLLKTPYPSGIDHEELSWYWPRGCIRTGFYSAGRHYVRYWRIKIVSLIQLWTLLAAVRAVLARCAHRYDSGINTIGVTNHLSPTPQIETHVWHYYWSQEYVTRHVIGLTGETAPTTTLLNVYSINWTLITCHYTYRSVSLNPHQKIFLLLYLAVNTESHNWSVFKG